MDKQNIPEIETERLLLRRIRRADLDQWTRLIFSDPKVMRYMPKRDMTPRDRANRAFEFHNQTWSHNDYGGWLVTHKSSGQILGDCYLEPEGGSGELELGYTIARDYWGNSIATESGRAVVRYVFERTSENRIVGVALPENIGSWRVLEHIGFVFEKNAHYYDLDVLVYAINRDNFQPGKAPFQIHDNTTTL